MFYKIQSPTLSFCCSPSAHNPSSGWIPEPFTSTLNNNFCTFPQFLAIVLVCKAFKGQLLSLAYFLGGVTLKDAHLFFFLSLEQLNLYSLTDVTGFLWSLMRLWSLRLAFSHAASQSWVWRGYKWSEWRGCIQLALIVCVCKILLQGDASFSAIWPVELLQVSSEKEGWTGMFLPLLLLPGGAVLQPFRGGGLYFSTPTLVN